MRNEPITVGRAFLIGLLVLLFLPLIVIYLGLVNLGKLIILANRRSKQERKMREEYEADLR